MNLLNSETSPYLLLHKDNPVDWMPWGEEAFARARAEGKPVLLSVGYMACHWCHVMAHESFEDAQTARLMNENFVCIKVDREERPDVDHIYQSALALTGQQGGWPLTMFLAQDGRPFWGGTYFPRTPRHGLPAFSAVLRGIAGSWEKERDKIGHNIESLAQHLQQESLGKQGAPVAREQEKAIAAHLVARVDSVHGGLAGRGPKFPCVPVFDLLWREWRRSEDAACRFAVLTTLTAMAQGGIYDHLGGGFARYAVDQHWLVPHFEKMLADNAQILKLMTAVWQETGHPLLEKRIIETADFLINGLRAGKGFAASLGADSEGVEGKFYVWSHAEIQAALGEDAALFCQHYDVTPEGNWEGVNILNRLSGPNATTAETEARLARARARLKSLRDLRPPPDLDDKVLADWNGLAIAALAQAGFAMERGDWLSAAREAFRFIGDVLGRDMLGHAWRQGSVSAAGLLDDYAAMVRAGLMLFEATGEKEFLEQAQTWADRAVLDFYDETDGGFFMTAAAGTALFLRPKTCRDTAQAAGNAMMAENLARLSVHTARQDYMDKAAATVRAFSGGIREDFFPLWSLVAAAGFMQDAPVLAFRGQDMEQALRKLGPSGAVLVREAGTGDSLHVCIGPQCLAQTQDPAQAAELVRATLAAHYKTAANDV